MSRRSRSLLAEHEDFLAEQAETLTVKDFTTLARRWAAIADDHLAGDTHPEHQPRNEVHAAVTMHGRLEGTFSLDPVAGPHLVATLDHLAPPDPADAADGVRSLSERRGDALADLARWYHHGAQPSANPPNINVIVDVATLGDTTPDLAQMRCELEGIGPIARATLDQLGCSATLSRLVMAGESVVLDMGRRSRLATAAQARAVRVRDQGCIFPSCGRLAQWCEIHHIDAWSEGGRTDIARLACLCARHHTLIHISAWTILVNPDGTFRVTHPTRAP